MVGTRLELLSSVRVLVEAIMHGKAAIHHAGLTRRLRLRARGPTLKAGHLFSLSLSLYLFFLFCLSVSFSLLSLSIYLSIYLLSSLSLSLSISLSLSLFSLFSLFCLSVSFSLLSLLWFGFGICYRTSVLPISNYDCMCSLIAGTT